jgi:hypothetical protein
MERAGLVLGDGLDLDAGAGALEERGPFGGHRGRLVSKRRRPRLVGQGLRASLGGLD